MMDPIKPLDGLTEILRKRIAEEIAAKGNVSVTRKSADSHQETQPASRPTTEALRKKIATALESLDPDDPKREQKIVHIFVENTLSWQFGSELINDPGFSMLVNDISDALEPESAQIEQLIKA
jgi:hypothetical protein